jgi:hypothetical protein
MKGAGVHATVILENKIECTAGERMSTRRVNGKWERPWVLGDQTLMQSGEEMKVRQWRGKVQPLGALQWVTQHVAVARRGVAGGRSGGVG